MSYKKWLRIIYSRSQDVDITLNMVDTLTNNPSGTKDRDVLPSEIRKSEKCVTKKAFIKDRLEKNINFFERMELLNLRTLRHGEDRESYNDKEESNPV